VDESLKDFLESTIQELDNLYEELEDSLNESNKNVYNKRIKIRENIINKLLILQTKYES
jgi:hypothetical protein